MKKRSTAVIEAEDVFTAPVLRHIQTATGQGQ